MTSPILIQPGEFLTSIDGTWSTFPLTVGNIPLNVIPSTALAIDYVVVNNACQTYDSQGQNGICATSRGGVYNSGLSQTYTLVGTSTVQIEEYLGVIPSLNYSIYGTDTVALGYNGTGGPALANSFFGSFESPTFWLGYLGILPVQIEYESSLGPNYFQMLYNQSQIPSLSFGFTAGSYESSQNSSPASLILGGYDANRFTSNDLVFPMLMNLPGGPSQYLSLQLNSIMADGTPLLTDSITVTLDSTLPYMWLPLSVCDTMANQFNLTYDNNSELYFVNDTVHATLRQQNPTFTFTFITNQFTMVNITVPYSAFDLVAQNPLVNSTQISFPLVNITRYFPLKQSKGQDYALGRAFLQYTYIVADFGAQNFRIGQVKPMGANYTPDIVAIYSNVTTAPRSSHSSSGSDAGAIAGGVVGGVVGTAIIAFLIWFFVIRKRRSRHDADRERQEPSAAELPVTQRQPLPEKNPNGLGAFGASGQDAPGIGSPGSEHLPIYPVTGELAGSEHGYNRYELDAAQHSELPGEREDGNDNAVGATDTETGTGTGRGVGTGAGTGTGTGAETGTGTGAETGAGTGAGTGTGTGADTSQKAEETEASHNTTTNEPGSSI